jgi:hypothetical protein
MTQNNVSDNDQKNVKKTDLIESRETMTLKIVA